METPPVLHTWGVTHLFYNNCSQICGCSKPSAVDGLNLSLSLRQWKHIPAVCWGFTVSLLSAVSDTKAWTRLEKRLETSWSSQQGKFLCPTGRQAELKDDLIQRQSVCSVLLLCSSSGLCSRMLSIFVLYFSPFYVLVLSSDVLNAFMYITVWKW